jgi:hypothetical protein
MALPVRTTRSASNLLSSGRSIEFVAPLLDPIRSDVEDPTSTHTGNNQRPPTGPGVACSEKIQEGLLGA